MPKNERGPAVSSSQNPQLSETLPQIIGIAFLEKQYLRDLASMCQDAAATDDTRVIEAALTLFEGVPAEVRRMRRERAELSRPNQMRWSA